MTTLTKTIIATGASSGLGFEWVKQLLRRPHPHTFILGARDPKATQAAYEQLEFDATRHDLSIFPLDLSNLASVKSFARQSLKRVGDQKLDVLFLNAGMNKAARGPGLHGSQWCEAYLVNHLAQHYLTFLLEGKIVMSHSRVVVVSSGLVRSITEKNIENFEKDLKADSGAEDFTVYKASKFIQFLGAHWWRRRLADRANVFAISPGLVMGTGLGRHLAVQPNVDHIPDKLTVEEGATNLLRAVDQAEFPHDPQQIFLTSWGEWWSKDVYQLTLDETLQDVWCPDKEDIEEEIVISDSGNE